MPGVQNPHCTAHLSTNPFFTASAFGSAASPSMVTTSRPLQSAANSRQELSDAPSTRMVQAPHSPSPQPYLVPVRPSTSRSRFSALKADGTATRRPTPFRVNSISTFADMAKHPSQDIADQLAPVPIGGAHVADRADVGLRRFDRGVDRGLVQSAALERGLGLRAADRGRGHGADRA